MRETLCDFKQVYPHKITKITKMMMAMMMMIIIITNSNDNK